MRGSDHDFKPNSTIDTRTFLLVVALSAAGGVLVARAVYLALLAFGVL